MTNCKPKAFDLAKEFQTSLAMSETLINNAFAMVRGLTNQLHDARQEIARLRAENAALTEASHRP